MGIQEILQKTRNRVMHNLALFCKVNIYLQINLIFFNLKLFSNILSFVSRLVTLLLLFVEFIISLTLCYIHIFSCIILEIIYKIIKFVFTTEN